jgi:hypothetical protein
MAQRENNTMVEGCDKLLKQIASMEQDPDADMEFLGALRGDILTYLKPPTASQPQQPSPMDVGGMGSAMGQVMGGGGGAPMPVGGGGPMMAGAGPMPMGLTSGDELRRTMGKSSQRHLVQSLLSRMPNPV